MPPPSETDRLLAAARAYEAAFDKGGLPTPPAKKVAVLACMDSRIDLFALLGLGVGDAHVIRNAGGVVTDDAIRSLALSQHLLGTEEIVLIHHTGCGLHGLSDENFADLLETDTGVRPEWKARGFADVERAVREAIATIVASPFIPHTDSVRGFVYEVETGALREVRA
jgi:carbonic anhydrase